jgi:hypothetical protein
MKSRTVERAVTVLSIACAVECLLLPLAAAAAPLGTTALHLPPLFEWTVIGFAVAVSSVMFARGYLSHGKLRYLAMLAVASVLFAATHLGFADRRAPAWSAAPSLLLVAAQIGNRRRSGCAADGHQH